MAGVSILSIQSSVAYGHVGNSAAVFPLQRLGIEVWPVVTVHFSNHTGYGQWRGPLLAAEDLREVLTGIEERGRPGTLRRGAVGYQGAEEVGDGGPRRGGPGEGSQPRRGVLLRPGDGRHRARLLRATRHPGVLRDHVIPRPTSSPPTTSSSTSSPARERAPLDGDRWRQSRPARAMGPATVLVTSVVHDGTGQDTLEMLAVDRHGAWLVSTPLLPDHGQRCRRPHGRAVPRPPARDRRSGASPWPAPRPRSGASWRRPPVPASARSRSSRPRSDLPTPTSGSRSGPALMPS